MTDRLMEPEENVARIMRTGTVWFGVAVLSVALWLGPLLASGWRPTLLDTPVQMLWWIGAAFLLFAIGLIGWSGCPVLEVSVAVASRNKSRTMQVGTALFIVGTGAALFAVMLGPIH